MKFINYLMVVSFITLLSIISSASPSTEMDDTTDPLVLLQQYHPAVYNHLIHEYEKPQAVQFSVKENVIYISFRSNNHTISSVYTANGKIRYSVVNLGLTLPDAVSNRLKKEYPSWSVYYGKQITANNRLMYEVVIENEQEYKVISFRDAEMEETQQLKK